MTDARAHVGWVSAVAALVLVTMTAPEASAQAAPQGATLVGTTTTEDGEAVSGICVTVWGDLPGPDGPVREAVSDIAGQYAIEGIDPGEYRVLFFDCGHGALAMAWYPDQPVWRSAQPIVLSEGETARADAALHAAAGVLGTVRDRTTDDPLVGICVGVFDDDGLLVDVRQTDGDGSYEIGGLREAQHTDGVVGNLYRILFADCNDPPVHAHQWFPGSAALEDAERLVLYGYSNFDAWLDVAGAITGRATSRETGAGAAEVCAGVLDRDGRLLLSAVTGSDGTYALDGVPPAADHRVAFSDCAEQLRFERTWYGDAASAEEATPVAVRSGQTTAGITATLQDAAVPPGEADDPSSWPAPEAPAEEPPAEEPPGEGPPDEEPPPPPDEEPPPPPGEQPPPPPGEGGSGVVRWAGAGRVETAGRISQESFLPGVPVAYVATGGNFPDALTGGAAAGLAGGPVLLVDRDAVPDATAAELDRLRPQRIVVLGGTGAVSADVEAALGAHTHGDVARLFGADRYETAAAISRSTFAPGVPEVYVATGENFPDALAGGAAAVRSGAPVLLTTTDRVPRVTSDELIRLSPERIVLLGGPSVVSDAVREELAHHAGVVERVSGVDRFATAAAVAEARFAEADTVFVATGADFPDALAGVPAAGEAGAPLLLVDRDTVGAPTREQLHRLAPGRIVVLGGPAAVSDAVAQELSTYLDAAGAPARSGGRAAPVRPATTSTLRGRPAPEAVAQAYAAHGGAYVSRGLLGGLVDLSCGHGVVGAAAPNVVNAHPGQYAWWRTSVWVYTTDGWWPYFSDVWGPWHYAHVGGGYGVSSTTQMFWQRPGSSATYQTSSFTVTPGRWYAVWDEIRVDGRTIYSFAYHQGFRTPWCQAS